MQNSTLETPILRDLGDGLILRRATPADAEQLAEFNSKIHSDDGPDKPDDRLGAWTLDLMSGHPTFQPGDFTVVEDTRAGGKIVSTLNLISQTWAYGGIPFGVGRPELVGTLEEYRNRGLVRAQFDVIHRWSAERGEMLQCITGIPYYYRLFEYEMALDLGGGRAGFKSYLPKLKEGESEPYNVRPATEADLGFIAELYDLGCRRYPVKCVWNDTLWRYELNGKRERDVNRYELRVIETPQGEAVGFLAHPPFTWGKLLAAICYELKPGVSWGAVTPSVARYLYATGEKYAEKEGKQSEFGSFGLWLGRDHPAYKVLQSALPRVRKPYAFYIRVPDVPGFIRHIAPALEQRLALSPYVGHTAEIDITFYSRGLKLGLEKGRIVKAEAWRPMPQGHSGVAAFPGLTFLQLLFGYRSFDELQAAFPDCWSESDEATGLLNALFPAQGSDVWPIA